MAGSRRMSQLCPCITIGSDTILLAWGKQNKGMITMGESTAAADPNPDTVYQGSEPNTVYQGSEPDGADSGEAGPDVSKPKTVYQGGTPEVTKPGPKPDTVYQG
jgi:hypothetical protein